MPESGEQVVARSVDKLVPNIELYLALYVPIVISVNFLFVISTPSQSVMRIKHIITQHEFRW